MIEETVKIMRIFMECGIPKDVTLEFFHEILMKPDYSFEKADEFFKNKLDIDQYISLSQYKIF